MCGIAGRFGTGRGESIAPMVQSLAHRGPDDEHIVSGEDFAIGARRLSILDIETGRQPVTNERKTVWAAQNGEIYNFPDVRANLIQRGHTLLTRCDTEILPHLYEDDREDFVKRIDGMFAVALWDDERKVGFLARDRMGKKPLYYYRQNDSLYFSSEIKSLLRIPGFERQINFEAMHHYLSYKHVPCPLSIFRGVFMLPPGHLLTFAPGKEPQMTRYWRANFSPDAGSSRLSEAEVVDRLLALLRRGVKRRLLSDVPVGFFLSGGVDSSLATVLAAELTQEPIKTFTLTYSHESTTEGKDQDRRWARWVSERYGTEHHEEIVEFSNFPDNLRRAVTCFDEPFAGVISTYYLSQLISKHVKVAVSGDGADELFGSYLSHRLAIPLSNYPEFERTGNLGLIPGFEAQEELLAKLAATEDWMWRYKLLVYSDEEKREIYSPDVARALEGVHTFQHVRGMFSGLTAQDPLNRVLEAEWNSVFPDQVLAFVDRLSMAHSLEVRTAFLDTDLVSFIASLPGALKIKNGETKYLLKQAARRYFPDEMVFRKKEGFLMPITQWLLRDLEGYVRDTLSSQRMGKHGLFQTGSIQRLVDGLYQNKSDYQAVNKVYSLLVFQEWYDLYMV